MEKMFVICVRKDDELAKLFENNNEGACCRCGNAVVFRPYMPPAEKICMQCAVKEANGDEVMAIME